METLKNSSVDVSDLQADENSTGCSENKEETEHCTEVSFPTDDGKNCIEYVVGNSEDAKKNGNWLSADCISFSESNAFPEDPESLEVRNQRRSRSILDIIGRLRATKEVSKQHVYEIDRKLAFIRPPSFTRNNEVKCKTDNQVSLLHEERIHPANKQVLNKFDGPPSVVRDNEMKHETDNKVRSLHEVGCKAATSLVSPDVRKRKRKRPKKASDVSKVKRKRPKQDLFYGANIKCIKGYPLS